jgi:hypothetical protein
VRTARPGVASAGSGSQARPPALSPRRPGSASSYAVDIYRMGYYGGDGARLIASVTPNVTVSQNQPACNTNSATGLVDWQLACLCQLDSTYHRRVRCLLRTHPPHRRDQRESQIPFVVTDNSSHSDVVFMTSDETWQASMVAHPPSQPTATTRPTTGWM